VLPSSLISSKGFTYTPDCASRCDRAGDSAMQNIHIYQKQSPSVASSLLSVSYAWLGIATSIGRLSRLDNANPRDDDRGR
jgi:hypothetical protein